MPPIRYRYQTLELGDHDVHVRTLRDRQQFHDEGGVAERLGIYSATWPLFGVIWDSGRALATLMIDYPIGELRILEVGCGIGLASLVLNRRDADISATDHHPETGGMLSANAQLNGDREIPYLRADWAGDEPRLGRFDLIIGSDLLYETGQVELLSRFINEHANHRCVVLIVDPGRGQCGRMDKRMSVLGYETSRTTAPECDDEQAPFKGSVLRYER